jgi:hypothetical protein
MGCDIHSYAETKWNGKWELSTKPVFKNSWYDPKSDYFKDEPKFIPEPFNWRSYSMYGFLADVRNYSYSPVISEPRGLPDDVSDEVKKEYDYWDMDGHSHSWLTLRELLDYDYDQIFEDRRTTKDGDGAADAGEGNGVKTSIREFLGESFFEQIEGMQKLGNPEDVRVVFWFDN